MKTITFYSYKGGVGRSLALSNVAMQLSQFKKKVVVLDFDLEAPGLHFKFQYKSPIEKGIVDYIYKFACEGVLPDNIKDYSINLEIGDSSYDNINFIPAGNIDNKEYWKKLSGISWADMFYKQGGNGVRFFLDLKAKIEKEFEPDFLLIDSRTGITDIAGITLRLLADEVVILAANNEENLFGSKKIIKSLLEPSNILFDKTPKIIFVLTRIPFSGEPKFPINEFALVESIKKEFNEYLILDNFEFSVIHTDRRLEINELQLIGEITDDNIPSISKDYLDLFYKLTKGQLSEDEIATFKNKRRAEREYEKSIREEDLSKQLNFINNSILFDNTNPNYYGRRGAIYFQFMDLDKALKDYEHLLKLKTFENLTGHEILMVSKIYVAKKNYDKALEIVNKGLKLIPNEPFILDVKFQIYLEQNKDKEAFETLNNILEIYPDYSGALNNRADYYRRVGEFEKAFIDITKAIEVDPEMEIGYITLAEIYASQDKINEFYLNLSIGLSKGINATVLNSSKDVLKRFRNDERFVNLMNRYEIYIDEIFGDHVSPVQFYSCFISYSSKDEEFAKKLYNSLQEEGIRCWFAPEDLKTGDYIKKSINNAIIMHDRLLLILSENSVHSHWMEREVETAFDKEKKSKTTVLYPIRLDDSFMQSETDWTVKVRKERHVGDFRKWKDHDAYQKAFERLLKDLKQ